MQPDETGGTRCRCNPLQDQSRWNWKDHGVLPSLRGPGPLDKFLAFSRVFFTLVALFSSRHQLTSPPCWVSLTPRLDSMGQHGIVRSKKGMNVEHDEVICDQ